MIQIVTLETNSSDIECDWGDKQSTDIYFDWQEK